MSSDSTVTQANDLPSFEFLCLEHPLYSKVEIDTENKAHRQFMSKLRRAELQFDAYCVGCKKSSTFKYIAKHPSGSGSGTSTLANEKWMFETEPFQLKLSCTRHGHEAFYYFKMILEIGEGKLLHCLQKVGQSPSIEDVASGGIEKYRNILGKEYFAELRRATGLASHGIGIGAFVYLRRIFEKLVYDARDRAAKAEGFAPIEGFDSMRMDEKIKALASELPRAMVNNRTVYGILSQGIHELDENRCRTYFPVVRSAIIQMLEQDYQIEETRKAEQEVERQIQSINAQLKSE
jgi:hypothetical protein